MYNYVYRGEIYYADLSPVVGCEEGGTRPVLVIQNNVGNTNSPTVIVACITKAAKKVMPTHVDIWEPLNCESTIQLEQIKTIDKSRLISHIGNASEKIMHKVNDALMTSLDLR